MSTIVITGTTRGLGKMMKAALKDAGHDVIGLDLEQGYDVSSLKQCGHFVRDQLVNVPKVDVLINNAGINKIGYLEDFKEEDYLHVMDTNAMSIFNMSKSLLSHLNGGTILNIVSNASHMPMTASLAYNASKAAAHIITLQLARELKPRHNIDVFGIAPNKLAGTGMSKDIEEQCCKVRGWTPEFAREYQLKALPAGEETDPYVLAQFINYLLMCKSNHKYFHGCIIPYGA
jgi:NAD(P)-dependent dehydrogenase (short-subunit alcohol dehydrogenase family)